MFDLSWLAQEARNLHQVFDGLFYPVVTVFLLLGVVLEYFKWPLGGVPSFPQLVGRALVATLLLHAYPEITNSIADLGDALASRLGDLNQFKLVLSRMGDKLGELSASWISVKEATTLVISFLTFFALYFSVYVAQGLFMFAWLLSYVFAPVLIALYVLPGTAGTTKALFRTLFEVSCWKVVWSTLATLLWSLALSQINQPGPGVNFVAVICLNLTLAASILLTPWIVHALANTGLAGFSRTVGSIAVGTTVISPQKVVGASRQVASVTATKSVQGVQASRNFFAEGKPISERLSKFVTWSQPPRMTPSSPLPQQSSASVTALTPDPIIPRWRPAPSPPPSVTTAPGTRIRTTTGVNPGSPSKKSQPAGNIQKDKNK